MSAPTEGYGPLDGDEQPRYAAILNRCFGQSGRVEESERWAAKIPLEDHRTLREDGEPIACLSLLPMGQWFGGRSVSTAGVAGVGVDLEHRGRGHARTLMASFLAEARERGFALSSLYASTFTLYRAVGYERAGSRGIATVRPTELMLGRTGRSALTVRGLTADDREAVRACRSAWCRHDAGQFDRGEYLWGRSEVPRDQSAHGVVFEGQGGLEGYARWVQSEAQGRGAFDINVNDYVALTPAAVRAMLDLFTDQRSLVGRINWAASPRDPLLAALPERQFELVVHDQWMVRVLDVQVALEGRGWPAGVEMELELEVDDELLVANSGRYRLQIADGRAVVEEGGAGRIRTGARGLAPLFSGHLGPHALARLGWIEGADADLERAATAFAGPEPWATDMF
ncbi:MAG: GNAT family N-acetyltransferase [bacterium]|nr:GNAT family N-acetyltransferase [bacterium]